MVFGVNTSPMAGRDGAVRHLAQPSRPVGAANWSGNVSIRVEDTDSPEQVQVIGARRAAVVDPLIEMMRREGYEVQVSRPRIVTRRKNGRTEEPVEELVHRRGRGLPGGSSSRSSATAGRR